ncbi:MAG: hypothetical protein JWQ19_638 [Subtercola sp.]|nr:hypothetical protein [Subtercola sp.]
MNHPDPFGGPPANRRPRRYCCRMDTLPPVVLGDRTVFVDSMRPVAAVRNSALSIQFVTWPDASLPPLSATTRTISEPTGVWVIYSEIETLWSLGKPRSTAVHIDQRLTVSAIDLGTLTPIGADGRGLWCTAEPYPIVERMSDSGSFDPGFIEIGGDAPLEDREDLNRTPPAEDRSRTSPTTIPRLATPLPPTATAPVTLHRYQPNGNVEYLTVDRLVSGIDVVGDKLRFTYHPTGPIERRDIGGTSSSFSYPVESIDLDLTGELPSEVVVGDHASTPLGRGFPEEWLYTHLSERRAKTEEDEMIAKIDLSTVDNCDWTLPAEDEAAVSTYVASVLNHLTSLDEPNLVWTRSDNQVHRVRSEYRDLVVKVVGNWPKTEVVAEFTCASKGTQQFRLRVPVFDNAGRPRVPQYLTVYLTEDLATRKYGAPDPATAFIDLRG